MERPRRSAGGPRGTKTGRKQEDSEPGPVASRADIKLYRGVRKMYAALIKNGTYLPKGAVNKHCDRDQAAVQVIQGTSSFVARNPFIVWGRPDLRKSRNLRHNTTPTYTACRGLRRENERVCILVASGKGEACGPTGQLCTRVGLVRNKRKGGDENRTFRVEKLENSMKISENL